MLKSETEERNGQTQIKDCVEIKMEDIKAQGNLLIGKESKA